jgi:hypothetical protein
VIGNTGSNSTGEALHATEQGFAVGMHAALQINPYYGKTSKAGLKAHFDAGDCGGTCAGVLCLCAGIAGWVPAGW